MLDGGGFVLRDLIGGVVWKRLARFGGGWGWDAK
jgi:hypothetical protein